MCQQPTTGSVLKRIPPTKFKDCHKCSCPTSTASHSLDKNGACTNKGCDYSQATETVGPADPKPAGWRPRGKRPPSQGGWQKATNKVKKQKDDGFSW